jgi:hypothetical protein
MRRSFPSHSPGQARRTFPAKGDTPSFVVRSRYIDAVVSKVWCFCCRPVYALDYFYPTSSQLWLNLSLKSSRRTIKQSNLTLSKQTPPRISPRIHVMDASKALVDKPFQVT